MEKTADGRLITAQILDGLYPTTVFVMAALSTVGLEIVTLLVGLEFLLSITIAVVTKTPRVSIVRNIVPFTLIWVLVLPVLTYTYLRVGTDIVTGNRDWRK